MQTTKKKHKIVVLTNLKDDNLNGLLKSAVKLAQIIDGQIKVFNVQKPSEVVKKENQLSAVKSIYSKRISTDKKMQGFIEPVSKKYGITINYSSSIGNVKSEIFKCIESNDPDIIILGKRKSGTLKLIGDGITEYILNIFRGDVVIIPNKNILNPEEDISLGTLNATKSLANLKFSKQLFEHSKNPIRSFRFEVNSEISKEPIVNKENKTIEYLFDHNENALEKLPSYISKNNINLLVLNNKNIKDANVKQLNFGSLISKLNVPLIMVGAKNIA